MIARERAAFHTAAMTTHPLDRLHARVMDRKGADPKQSYTAKLLAGGPTACAKKVGEEAVETALAAVQGDRASLARESADLLYHLTVLWTVCDLPPADVYAELAKREHQSGLEEKLARKE